MNEKADIKKTLSIIVDNMRERRRILGISQEQLAERANLSVNYISKIEIGLKIPSLSTTIRIAKALEMEVSDIFANKTAKWINETQEIGFTLHSLPDMEAEFLIKQFRDTLKLIRSLHSKPNK